MHCAACVVLHVLCCMHCAEWQNYLLLIRQMKMQMTFNVWQVGSCIDCCLCGVVCSRKKAGNLNWNLQMDYRQIPLAQDSGNLPLINIMTGISAELARMQEFLQEYGTKASERQERERWERWERGKRERQEIGEKVRKSNIMEPWKRTFFLTTVLFFLKQSIRLLHQHGIFYCLCVIPVFVDGQTVVVFWIHHGWNPAMNELVS